MSSGSTGDIRSELADAFSATPGSDDAFVEQCSGLCQTFNIAPTDLYYKWESLVMSSSFIGTRIINEDTVQALRGLLQADLNKTKAVTQSRVKPEFSGKMMRGKLPIGMLGLESRVNSRTSGMGLVRPAATSTFASSSSSSTPIARAGPSKVSFSTSDDDESRTKRAYRYMYEKIMERSEVLDDRIDDFAEMVRDHYNLVGLGDPTSSTEEDCVVVGRITLDSESATSDSAKLNEASLCLESSRSMGSGGRVPLKFDSNVKVRGGPKDVGAVGLFPGAIVALKGKNGGGGRFTVSEILTLPPLKPSSHGAEGGVKSDAGAAPFSMSIACGPFTPDANLAYQPWSSLLQKLQSEKPDVVLLVGPFIDAQHPKIKIGDIDETPVEMFYRHFTDNLREFLDGSPDSIVLLVPSVRDMISSHAAFPQLELGAEFAGDSRIKLLPNPCLFSLNGLSFGVSSVDVLFHLRNQEIIKRGEEVDSVATSIGESSTDAMSATCRHLLQQRSFYPVFPVPFELSSEVNLDVSHSDGLDICADNTPGVAPDVIVTSSKLKYFSKVVDHTVVINPGFVSKGTSATLNVGRGGQGPAWSRVQADVKKFGA